MNQWLQKKWLREAETYKGVWHNDAVVFPIGTLLKDLKSRLTVSFWVDSGSGERAFIKAVYPFEEVISHPCAVATMIDGFSIWLDGMTEVMWQSLGGQGILVPAGGSLEIRTNSIHLSLLPPSSS
jgi:hypothetical protein